MVKHHGAKRDTVQISKEVPMTEVSDCVKGAAFSTSKGMGECAPTEMGVQNGNGLSNCASLMVGVLTLIRSGWFMRQAAGS